MPRTYRFIIGPADAGIRVDRYLVRHLPAEVSRGVIQRAILGGAVTVGGRPVKPHRVLKAGEVIETLRTESASPKPTVPLPQPITLEVVYEDAALLVVNKPAGLVTHPAPGHWDGTLVNAVLWHLQNAGGSRLKAEGKGAEGSGLKATASSLQPPASSQRSLEPSLPRAGIVHRLDKETSGLLLVAKTERAHVQLSKQLKDRTVNRRYLALIEGQMPADEGTMRASIGRHQRHRKLMTVRHLGGRTAVTHYRVLKRFGPDPLSYSLLEVSLETGRTHQIRVHLAHLEHPVLGDTTYGRRSAGYWASLGIVRHLLHAYRLGLRHPETKQPMVFTAGLPDDMIQRLPGFPPQWCPEE